MPPITLEQIVGKLSHKQNQDILTLDFSNSKIVKIGTIPKQVSSQVQVLNLANNNLRSLQGIEQFSKLQSLNLKNNKISQGHSLLALKNLLHLKRIFLQGNSFLENPLSQEILSLLSSFQNDLQILDYAFEDPERQALVKEHRRSKSKSRILTVSHAKMAGSQQQLHKLSRDLHVSKLVQKSKVNMLMSQMQQYIQQKHESQEISSYDIEKVEPIPQHTGPEHDQSSFMKIATKNVTPPKKNTKFSSLHQEKRMFDSLKQPARYQEESTNLKRQHLTRSNIEEEDFPYVSKTQSVIQKNEGERFSRSQRIHESKKSPQRKFKYQVDNLKIDMDLNSRALNYPSITQKEDQDSYQIEFDFISPKKLTLSNRKAPFQASPSEQLKQITASYLKIQQDEAPQQKPKQKIQEIKESWAPPSPISAFNRPQISSATLSMLTKSKALEKQKKSVQKISDKQNIHQRPEPPLSPINMARKGSLYQSVRNVVPQSNTTAAQDIINRLLNKSSQQSQSISVNTLSEMIQNGQKFQKFYYTSLTRLKPAFSLLYSPFSSLKAEEKDLLLQELFKNHKQIFILLIKEFHAKEKLSEELRTMSSEVQKGLQWVAQNKELNEKLNEYERILSLQQTRCQNLELQNKKLQRYADQFEDILASRQKIIRDVKSEYEKVNKTLIKKQSLFQKFLNQDQIQQQIIEKKQKRLKSQFLKLINKNAQWTSNLRNFIQKRQNRENVLQQRRKYQLKTLIFQGFKKNLNKQKAIRQFQNTINMRTMDSFFYQWKMEANCQRLSNQLQHNLNLTKKNQSLLTIHKFYLNSKRNKKVKDIAKIKLLKVVFFKGFKQNHSLFQQRFTEFQKKSAQFYRMKMLEKYFSTLNMTVKIMRSQIIQNINKVQKQVIQKRQISLFRKIIRYQNKDQQEKSVQIQQNVIRQNEIRLFLRNIKAQAQHRVESSRKLNKAIEFRLNRYFGALKKIAAKNIKKFIKFQNIAQKVSHQIRLRILVCQFKQNDLKSKCENKKKQQLFNRFNSLHKSKETIVNKKQSLLSHLNFRRGLKAKNEFISYLRHFNIKRKMNSKQLVLEHHYLTQQSKYKQSYELNILTMQQLKDEIITCLGEIQFYKIQVQKLSQRELLILEEKQNYLLDIQCKQQQNHELRKAILDNERRLQEIQRKYQKSLDMYAEAIKELNSRQAMIDRRSFFYDPLSQTGAGQPVTFRRQMQQTFTSLRR